MKLSDYVLKYMETVVDSVFLVSGGGVMHIVDSIGKSNLTSICTHHEQGAALAAEGYARMKNDIGFCVVTTGPGGTNAVTGVAACWIDNIPIIVISGQVRKEIMIPKDNKYGLRQLGPQEINIVDIVKPITKYALTVEEPNSIKYHLQKAIYLAKSGKPGPVWLDVPLDVQSAEIDEKSLESFQIPEEKECVIPTARIAAELKRAQRPLLLIGQGIRLAKAEYLLAKFIEKTKINVISAMSGDDIVTYDYLHYLGPQGITGRKSANYAIDNCDVLLIVGTSMQLRQTSFDYKEFAKGKFIIMADIDPAQLNKKTITPDISVCCDAKIFLEKMLEEKIILKRWDLLVEEIAYKTKSGYVDVYHFMEELNGKSDFPIVTANGMAAEVPHQAFKLRIGQRLITNTGLGEMGKGLPMAIGACIANNKKPVICMEGDGSIMMNIHELQTMIYHKLPLKIFIFNNGGYYSIRNTHNKFFGKVFAADESSGLSLPNWKNLMAGWGINYESISSEKDLHKLKNILESDGAIVCELVIDPHQEMIEKWTANKYKEKI
ncbi:MAG: thiamine pyrophosphate-binding protein [Nanoarchaeota archaeon]